MHFGSEKKSYVQSLKGNSHKPNEVNRCLQSHMKKLWFQTTAEFQLARALLFTTQQISRFMYATVGKQTDTN